MSPVERAAARYGLHPAALSAPLAALRLARIDAASEMYEAGVGTGDIGKALGVNPQTVVFFLKEAGVARRARGGWHGNQYAKP